MNARTSMIVVAVLALAPATAAVAQPDALHRLFEDFHAWEMRQFPERAMRRGDYENAHRITDQSIAAIERRHADRVGYRERLARLERGGWTPDDRVHAQVLALRLDHELGDHGFRMWLAPIGQRSGPHQSIPQMAEGVRFANTLDYENYVRRLEQVPAEIDHVLARLRFGLDEGRTPPRIVLEGVPGQLEALLAEDGLAPLAEPLERIPKHVMEGPRNAIVLRFEREALPAVRSALERLHAFLIETYLPGCREGIAATDLPEGEAFYAHQLEKMTTTNLTAKEIHEIGLAEVERIRGEMLEVIRRSDFIEPRPEFAAGEGTVDEDAMFAAFLEYLRTDPRFYHETEDALLVGYRDICKRVDAWLPKFFRTLPRLPYGVRKIPDFMAPQQTTAYYQFGSIDNAEPGWFYANTHALDQRPTYEMIALAMHEAVPGHHLQSAIAQELENVPEFRKYTWFNAYGEGWAPYSERLGIEMGLYEDPYDDFGRLLYEMWRACRLVVDPGMHAFGWTRDEAIEFMKRNTALSELNIVNEIDRYIGWPGQACGYKIGELRLRELRHEAEEKLGSAFDLRAFHEVVLGSGSVPLAVVERNVRRWVRSQPAGAVYD